MNNTTTTTGAGIPAAQNFPQLNRAAAIVAHLNAIAANRPRPSINAMADLADLDAVTLLGELESLFADLYPNNDACAVVLGELRNNCK